MGAKCQGNNLSKEKTNFWFNVCEYLKLDKYEINLTSNEIIKQKRNFEISNISNYINKNTIIELGYNISSILISREIVQNNNLNIYFAQLFPNINESNNTKTNYMSELDKSIIKDDWFSKIRDRLNRFLRMNNDNYEKYTKYNHNLNTSYNSRDLKDFNHSLDITTRSLIETQKNLIPLNQDNGGNDLFIPKIKRATTISDKEKLSKSLKNLCNLNLIREIEYSEDNNIPFRAKPLKQISKKLNRWDYSKLIRKKLFSGDYNSKKREESTNRIRIELKGKDRIKKKKYSSNKIRSSNLTQKNRGQIPSSPIMNKNFYFKNCENVYNTSQFLNEIELLININNHASMETYTSSKKYKSAKKKSHSSVKNKKSYSNKVYVKNLLNYQKNILTEEKDEIAKINSEFSLKEDNTQTQKTDVVKSLKSLNIQTVEDKSGLSKKNNLDVKSVRINFLNFRK